MFLVDIFGIFDMDCRLRVKRQRHVRIIWPYQHTFNVLPRLGCVVLSWMHAATKLLCKKYKCTKHKLIHVLI